MKLSRKTDYALRALVTLAIRQQEGSPPTPVRELAKINDIPRRFLEMIMLELKAAGWVTSVAGRIGGFHLAVPPEQLSMGQVVRLFDGTLAPLPCVSVTHHEVCSQETSCRFRRVLLDIRNYTARRMDQATLKAVVDSQPVMREEIFAVGFSGGDGI
ncbi:HTH-type transcriptional regulator CymR [Planctopirus ephydatiae]|jgi:Rrf2 family protein|uniref:HTH-type transcriptional regulator CymR n=1 Tax=Planctopirus ephydatiae TaxID=2528019 RepID=A0A518GTP7_9PLAN|nr:Rrf2 family transcriptional regulator [Planctopirus ephydatiae]QDV31968.1 HTH-type transcriptional regulator CymR [Planctopirus ephydatiae]